MPSDATAAPFRQHAHAERSAVGPRGEDLAANVAPADDLLAGEGDHHRVPIFEAAPDEPPRVRFRQGFEQRQVSALARNDIEGAPIAPDMVERHWLDPDGPLVQNRTAFSILSRVNSFIGASSLRSTTSESGRESSQFPIAE